MLYYKDEKSPWLEISFPAVSSVRGEGSPSFTPSSLTPSTSEERNEYELINLDPGKWYQIYMRAVSKKGSSDPSDILTIRTESADSNQLSLYGPSPSYPPYDRAFPSVGGKVSLSGSLSRDGTPTAITFNDWPTTPSVPYFLKSSFVLPLSVAIVIITIACSIAYVYLKKVENKAVLMRTSYSVSPSTRNFTYLGLPTSPSGLSPSSSNIPSGATSIVSEEGTITLRYSDSNGRLLLARPPIPTMLWAASQGPIVEEEDGAGESGSSSPYSTLPNFGGKQFGAKSPFLDPRLNCNITVNRLSSFNPIPPELPPPNKPISNQTVISDNLINNQNVISDNLINNQPVIRDNGNKRTSIIVADVHTGDATSSDSSDRSAGPLITFSSPSKFN